MAEQQAPRTQFPNTGSEEIPPGATRKAFDREQPPVDGRAEAAGQQTRTDTTQPAQEWGQREEVGKQIASGGKAHGNPPGTNPKRG
jgi:hypothetical protein